MTKEPFCDLFSRRRACRKFELLFSAWQAALYCLLACSGLAACNAHSLGSSVPSGRIDGSSMLLPVKGLRLCMIFGIMKQNRNVFCYMRQPKKLTESKFCLEIYFQFCPEMNFLKMGINF